MSIDYSASVFYGVILPGDWQETIAKTMGGEVGDPDETLDKLLPKGLGYSTFGNRCEGRGCGYAVSVRGTHTNIGGFDGYTKALRTHVAHAKRATLARFLKLVGIKAKAGWWITRSIG